MVLEIPKKISSQMLMSKEELLLELAIVLYQKEVISMRAAAELSKISWVQFEHILGERKIYLKYSEEDLRKDMENLSSL